MRVNVFPSVWKAAALWVVSRAATFFSMAFWYRSDCDHAGCITAVSEIVSNMALKPAVRLVFESDRFILFGFLLCLPSGCAGAAVLIYRAVNEIIRTVHAKAHKEPHKEKPFRGGRYGRLPAAVVTVIISVDLIGAKNVVDTQDDHRK